MNDVNTGIYVQYGCGLSAPPTWQNYDASPRLWLERNPVFGLLIKAKYGFLFPPNAMYGDVVKRLPVNDNSAECVFCSHIIEHLSSSDVDLALRESLRILKPGGVFRLVVPDLNWRAAQYLSEASDNNVNAGDDFLRSTLLGDESRAKSVSGFVRDWLGNSAHRWMFDYPGLSHRLAAAGFVAIRRSEFGDSEHASFKDVEMRDRFFEDENAELAIEAKKKY